MNEFIFYQLSWLLTLCLVLPWFVIALTPVLMSVVGLLTPGLVGYHFLNRKQTNAAAEHHPKVLLVDDDPNSLLLLQHSLKKNNIDFKMVKSPKEAIEQLAHDHFDVMFLDFSMPDMTGPQMLNKAEHELTDDQCTPVIFYSGNDIDYQQMAPMKHFVMKDSWNKNMSSVQLMKRVQRFMH